MYNNTGLAVLTCESLETSQTQQYALTDLEIHWLVGYTLTLEYPTSKNCIKVYSFQQQYAQ